MTKKAHQVQSKTKRDAHYFSIKGVLSNMNMLHKVRLLIKISI